MTGGGSGRSPDGGDGLRLLAPAKINLHLQVLGRRADGYHEIATVLQTINLCDELSLRLRQRRRDAADGLADVSLDVQGGIDVPAGERNLAVQAARALLQAAGAAGDVGLDIGLQKRIPAGGGLGGGSSDAAAVLSGLEGLLGAPCGRQRLSSLAAALGSDVAFFLEGGTALCTGRGEIVRPLQPPRPFDVTLLMPPFAVATAAVYAALRCGPAVRADADALERLAAAITGADAAGLDGVYRNDLSGAARRVEPRLAELLDLTGLHLSGSGSTLFGFGRAARDFAVTCPRSLICYAQSSPGNR